MIIEGSAVLLPLVLTKCCNTNMLSAPADVSSDSNLSIKNKLNKFCICIHATYNTLSISIGSIS